MQQPYVAQPTMTYGDWGYLLLAFVIFTVALAIVRRQFGHLAKKTNVRKEVKKRFGGLFGTPNAHGAGNANNRRPEDVDNLGFGADSKKGNQRDENLIDDESGSPGRKKVTYSNKGKTNFAMGMQYL